MNESDLLRAGMKIVGCFVVVGAICGFATVLFEAIGMIFVKSYSSPDLQRAVGFFWVWKSSSVVIGILRLILGLYLCTGAKAIVQRLQEKIVL